MEPSDAQLARTVADTAGRLLLALQSSGLFEPRSLGKIGDRVANDFIVQALSTARPDDAVLSEERLDDGDRLGRSRVWIVDPLDGTREFGEGRDDWAVHIGLAIDGRAEVGAVALPGRGLTLSTDQADLTSAAPCNAPTMVVSRTRPAGEALQIAEALDARLLPMGSAGAKAMAVVRGEADIYLHSGGQYEWDSCAPVAVALAAGLHVSRIDGSPMTYNRDNPYLPDLLICHPSLAPSILDHLRDSQSA